VFTVGYGDLQKLTAYCVTDGEVMTVNMSGRPVSAPSGIGNDNQKREAETTPDLPSPRVREGMTEYDGSVYSYDVTRAGLSTFFNNKSALFYIK
jgi:hypothetical protein